MSSKRVSEDTVRRPDKKKQEQVDIILSLNEKILDMNAMLLRYILNPTITIEADTSESSMDTFNRLMKESNEDEPEATSLIITSDSTSTKEK